VTVLQDCCFRCCSALSSVTTESGSRLSTIEPYAFSLCARLASIQIPSSVEVLHSACFSECQSLSTIEFAAGSKLSCVKRDAFLKCPTLSSIWIPPSLKSILGQYQHLLKTSRT
jgi:hypothetical protein